MLLNLLRRLIYDPVRHARRHPGVFLDAQSILMSSAHFRMASSSNRVDIAKNAMLACGFIFESDAGHIVVGEGTFINGGTSLICRSGIKIGRFVTIAWGCTIYDHNSHSLDYRDRIADLNAQLADYRAGRGLTKNKSWDNVGSEEIVIEDYAWIGMNSIILKGVKVGEGAVVGAGSVVRHDVEPWTVVAGNPAQFVKRLKHDD
ncbi:Galactoside O-acetyltransferase [Ectopseudomonas oleovorans]|uniref:Galactoside O-acetyltransferase n=1 Tax=Ectopseudomonas oleovorans TaxID=301 RepID=A0A653BA75_ECTOL|nr:Galactoside O-acetyltransferase [Pseudomonas oleovorans]